MKLPRQERMKYRRKHVTNQYNVGPQVITPMKLWSLIYLALRIHNENIHLADMLRYDKTMNSLLWIRPNIIVVFIYLFVYFSFFYYVI